LIITWITGIKGFIGRHLAKRLVESGIKVAGIDVSAWTGAEVEELGILSINGDVSLPNLDRLAMQTGIPDWIFHLAGGSSVSLSLQTPEEDFRRSVDSSIQLLEWARNHAQQTRFVLSSSAAVYGAGHSKPIRETDSLNPLSPYGYHKRISELLFESYSRNFGLYTAIIRLFSVYGTQLRKQLLWDLCVRFRDKSKSIVLSGNGHEKRDWLHVQDAVSYIVKLASFASDHCFIVNGGTGLSVDVYEIADHVRKTWGLETDIEFNGISRCGDPQFLVADMTFGRSIELFPTINWFDGIREYVAWFQNNEGK